MFRTDDHRYFWNGVGPYTSVTTAIKMYDKSAVFMGWAKWEVARFAVDHLDILVAHREHRSVEPSCAPCMQTARPYSAIAGARKWVASIPGYKADAARDLGTEVHGIAEAIGKGESPDVAPEFLPFAVQYRRFLADYEPKMRAVEYMGINRRHHYAGTGDILADIGGRVTCVDIKTHTKPTAIPDTYYPETAMQLAACSEFDFIGKEGDPTEYLMPKVERHAVLLLGRDDYRLIPYFPTHITMDAFVACLKLHAWQQGEARTVVGTPMKKEVA